MLEHIVLRCGIQVVPGRGLPKCPRRESDKMAPATQIRHEMAGLACGSGDGTGRKGGESWWWYGFCRMFSGFEN